MAGVAALLTALQFGYWAVLVYLPLFLSAGLHISMEVAGAALLTLLRHPDTTLCEVPLLLLRPEARKTFLKGLHDPVGLLPGHLVGGHHEVAGQRERAADAHGRPIHRRDDRLWEPANGGDRTVMMLVELPPLTKTGFHTHPGFDSAYCLDGSLTVVALGHDDKHSGFGPVRTPQLFAVQDERSPVLSRFSVRLNGGRVRPDARFS